MEINATLIGQLITFVILVWFVMRYVWPPITKAMQARELRIAQGLEASDRAKHELKQAEEQIATLIRAARQEAQQLTDQAHKRSNQIIDEAKVQAREEGKRLVEQARDEINREVQRAKEELRKQLGQLAVLGAEKIIRHRLDPSLQENLLAEFVAEIG